MHEVRQQLLDQALAFSQEMCDLAEQGLWTEVIELEAQRRQVLERAFATRDPVTEDLAQRVRAILDLDKGLMELSLRLRDEVADELGQFNRSRKASTAYRASAG